MAYDSTKLTNVGHLQMLAKNLKEKTDDLVVSIVASGDKLAYIKDDGTETTITYGSNTAYVVRNLFNLYTPFEAWKKFASGCLKDGEELNDILDRFFSVMDDEKTYTTKIAKSDTTGGYGGYSTTFGTNTNKYDDNADLACIPSTASVENVDDYQSIPGFLWLDCNYKIDETTLEPVITAVEGVGNGVDYTPDDDSFVGVITATYYRKIVQDDDYSTFQYAFGKRDSGFIPNCASIRVDGTVRNWTVRAKWLLNWNSDYSKLYNGKGGYPAAGGPSSKGVEAGYYALSYTTGHNYMQTTYGTQYGLESYETIAYAEDMGIWKYGVLGLTPIMSGCCSYNYFYEAVLSESGVKRIVISASNAANLVANSSASIGTDPGESVATWDKLSNASVYSVMTTHKIDSIETLEDGNVAINFDLDDSEAFDTVEGETMLHTTPWETGYTDIVLDKFDGTPINNTSAKEPFRLQGIEYMNGVREIAGDIKMYQTGSEVQYWMAKTAAERTTASSAHGTMIASQSVSIGECYDTTADDGTVTTNTVAWKPIYNEEFFEGGFIPTEIGSSYTQRYRAGMYKYYDDYTTGAWSEVLALGSLNDGSSAGVPFVILLAGLSYSNWGLAARPASASTNRGESS